MGISVRYKKVLRIMELNMLEVLPERTATTMNLQCHEKHKTTQKR
jgi:hypothetical protein